MRCIIDPIIQNATSAFHSSESTNSLNYPAPEPQQLWAPKTFMEFINIDNNSIVPHNQALTSTFKANAGEIFPLIVQPLFYF